MDHSVAVKFVKLAPLRAELHQCCQWCLGSKPFFASALAFRRATRFSQHCLHTNGIMKLEASPSRPSLWFCFSLHPPSWFRRGVWIRHCVYSKVRRHWKNPMAKGLNCKVKIGNRQLELRVFIYPWGVGQVCYILHLASNPLKMKRNMGCSDCSRFYLERGIFTIWPFPAMNKTSIAAVICEVSAAQGAANQKATQGAANQKATQGAATTFIFSNNVPVVSKYFIPQSWRNTPKLFKQSHILRTLIFTVHYLSWHVFWKACRHAQQCGRIYPFYRQWRLVLHCLKPSICCNQRPATLSLRLTSSLTWSQFLAGVLAW